MNIAKPHPSTFPEFYHGYVNQVPEGDIFEMLLTEHYETIDLITSIDLETQHFRYAEGKWNIKEIIQHIMDAERVFSCRAMCFARGETVSLPGFDENHYAANSRATRRNINDIAREFSVIRASTLELFKSMDEAMLDASGTANNKLITVRAILFVILGHELHHRKVIEERYLPK